MPDSQIMPSGSHDRTIRLWDAKTGALHKVLHANKAVRFIRFSTRGPRLDTNSGSFEIPPFVSDHHPIPYVPDPQVSLVEDWVALGGVKVLMLPIEYRQPNCLSIKDGALALGYRDGRVCIMKFRQVPPSIH